MTAADCPSGKRRYATELAARRALRAIRRSRRAALPGHERRAYLCRLCNNWHLTGHRNEFARLASPPRPPAAPPATLAALARVAAASTSTAREKGPSQ